MAQNKKSFIAYSDWYGMFKALPDEVAGKLIKHVFSYVNDENPECDDYIINALFEQIKASLKRDLKKWDKQREQRSLAGKRSAERRATKSNDRSTSVNENERNPTVSVNDSVSVSVSVNDSDKPILLKKETKKRFKPPTLLEIENLINERSYTVNAESFFNHYEAVGWKVGKNKMKDWKASLAGWNSRNKTKLDERNNKTERKPKISFSDAAKNF